MSNRYKRISRFDFPWACEVEVPPAQANQRHVDNVALHRIFHETRVALNNTIIGRMSATQGFSDQMIAHISTDFVAEVRFQPKLDVYARVSRIGRTSYELDLAIFVAEALAVRCTTVNVWVVAGAPCPISQEARAVLAALA